MTKYEKNLAKFLNGWQNNSDLEFIKKLEKQFPDCSVYLVGGMVRDIALGRESVDYDFVVTGVPGKKLEKALSKMGKVDLVGKNFGVYKFYSKKQKIKKSKNQKINKSGKQTPPTPPLTKEGNNATEAIDIALPRTEHAFGTGGYRDVEVQSDFRLPVKEDLTRRDFTINAMALQVQSPKSKVKSQIIDPYRGLADLAAGKIRAVGRAEERFKEDYSRMLRAIRLACQLSFEIETKTWGAIKKKIKNLNRKHPAPKQAWYGASKNTENTPHQNKFSTGQAKTQKHAIIDDWIVPREVIAKELVKAVRADAVRALELLDNSGALAVLMPELLKMKKCPQPKNFHAEGDVWRHTLLALKSLGLKKFIKEFSNYKLQPAQEIKKSSRLAGQEINVPDEVIWGLIFHDSAKPETKTFNGRIRFNEHDMIGVKIWRQAAERLKLASAGLDVDKVSQIISKHMLPTHGKPAKMRETTIEKYFFSEQFPGQELLMLIYADIMATVPPSGRPDFSSYNALKKRIVKLTRGAENKIRQAKLPKELLDGNEVMKILNIKPGAEIGRIKEQLREAQLSGEIKTKKEAEKMLLKKRSHR